MSLGAKSWVVDASVAAKWFIPEADSALAAQLVAPGIRLFAPDFLYAELGSVFIKRHTRGDLSAEQCAAAFRELEFMTVFTEPTANLVANAYQLAIETRRSIYDCLYLALAVRRDVFLITEDQRFWNALQTTRHRDHVVRLGDVFA